MSTINLPSLSNHKPVSVLDLFGYTQKEPIKYECSTDVLALSCAIYRNYLSTGLNRWTDLNSNTSLALVTDEDHTTAANIRAYYGKRITVARLSGRPLTNFMEDLSTLVVQDGRQYTDKNTGMYCRLPEFYQYDLTIDGIQQQYFTETVHSNGLKIGTATHDLLPVAQTLRVRKSGSAAEYWFKDMITKYPVCLRVDSKNQLLHLFQYIFDQGKQLQIEAALYISARSAFKYLYTDKWTLKQ